MKKKRVKEKYKHIIHFIEELHSLLPWKYQISSIIKDYIKIRNSFFKEHDFIV